MELHTRKTSCGEYRASRLAGHGCICVAIVVAHVSYYVGCELSRFSNERSRDRRWGCVGEKAGVLASDVANWEKKPRKRKTKPKDTRPENWEEFV